MRLGEVTASCFVSSMALQNKVDSRSKGYRVNLDLRRYGSEHAPPLFALGCAAGPPIRGLMAHRALMAHIPPGAGTRQRPTNVQLAGYSPPFCSTISW